MKTFSLSLMSAALLAVAGLPCAAATITWTNSAGGLWSVPSNWTPNQVPGSADTAVIDLAGSYVVTLHGGVSINGLVLGGASSTPTLQVDGNSGPASLTVANGFTNEGLIELTSSNIGYNATLNVTSGQLVNAPGATVAARVGERGGRTLGAALDNQGTLLVEQTLTWNKSGGQHLNSGTITLSGADINLAMNGGATFSTTGTIDLGSGNTFDVNSGTWAYAGGSISG